MANIKAAQTGNWSATSTWTGGVVPVSGDNVSSNNFTVTIDVNATVANVTNGTAYAATAGGSFLLNNGVTLTAAILGANSNCIISSGSASATLVGTITSNGGNAVNWGSTGTLTISTAGIISTLNFGVYNATSGTINIVGNATVVGGQALINAAGGTITITGNVTSGTQPGATNSSTGTFNIIGNVTAGSTAVGANNASTGTFTIIGDITATNGANGFTSSIGTNRLSGSFISSANGTAAIYATKYILNSTPLNAKSRYALNGISTYVDMFTADNSLTQANPTDVRTGVSYASGALTGTLTVPSEGTVSNGVTVGPLMPFTATRSLTTATATLAYSYPYTAGDKIVVTGASNTEWNGTYTIASVISGTSITFVVPITYSSTAGTGAQMQTVGTGIVTASDVTSAVNSAITSATTSIINPNVTSSINSAVPTAVNTAMDVQWNKQTSTLTTSGSIGERLANASTVAVTGQQITNALG